MDYQHALAAIVDALNDVVIARLSMIHVEGAYRVAFGTSDMKEAMERAKHLATTRDHPENIRSSTTAGDAGLGAGNDLRPRPTRSACSSARRLGSSREQRQRFEDLVLARGPIPDDILEKIWISHEKGRKPNQIAERMNELGMIAGMGGKRWTAQKVRKALAEYERRRDQHQEAA